MKRLPCWPHAGAVAAAGGPRSGSIAPTKFTRVASGNAAPPSHSFRRIRLAEIAKSAGSSRGSCPSQPDRARAPLHSPTPKHDKRVRELVADCSASAGQRARLPHILASNPAQRPLPSTRVRLQRAATATTARPSSRCEWRWPPRKRHSRAGPHENTETLLSVLEERGAGRLCSADAACGRQAQQWPLPAKKAGCASGVATPPVQAARRN